MHTEWQTLETLIRLLLGAVWSGSALYARSYLSENLGSLRLGMYALCSKENNQALLPLNSSILTERMISWMLENVVSLPLFPYLSQLMRLWYL